MHGTTVKIVKNKILIIFLMSLSLSLSLSVSLSLYLSLFWGNVSARPADWLNGFVSYEHPTAHKTATESLSFSQQLSRPILIDMALKTQLYLCNTQGVSVYTNISANYMFRPLLVRPSLGWIQWSEELYNNAILSIKETLPLHSRPTAVTGYNLEWPHGHNNRPL
jgi:hypothetical protein